MQANPRLPEFAVAVQVKVSVVVTVAPATPAVIVPADIEPPLVIQTVAGQAVSVVVTVLDELTDMY